MGLSSWMANGMVSALGLLLISTLIHLLLGPAAGAAASVGAIVVAPPDQPAPRKGKFTHFLPAVLIGTPLFFATGMLRHSQPELAVLVVGATFLAFLGAAWGKRGLPISVSVMFAMIFALAAPPWTSLREAEHQTFAFFLGAAIYTVWGTLANSLLNQRYRVLSVVDSLHTVATLMRTQGLHFTMAAETQQRTALVGRLMKQQAALADQLQTARNILLEAPTTPRRLQLAGMLIQLLDMRDHLVACALDLDAVRADPGQQELLRVLGVELQALAGDLEELGDAMLLGRTPTAFSHARPLLAAETALAPGPSDADMHAPPVQVLAGALSRRVGYVHDEVLRLVALARGEREPDVDVVRTAWQLFVSPTKWSWRPFLTLWRWDAPPLRHAIRAALAIATGLVVGILLPWGSHEYWILLTIVVVLRGSLAQTLERRNSRVAGTLLGCVLAGGLLYARLPAAALVVLVAVFQGIAHAFALQRYVVTAVAATVLALVQAHLLNPGASAVFEVAERVLDTLIGATIAWVFSYVLPSWERTQVGALVARTLAAQAKHAQLSLALAQEEAPGADSELAWRLARREAYDSLSALVQAIQRSLSEPRAVRPPLRALERMLAHSYQLLAQLTAIKTMLLQRRDRLNVAQLQGPLDQAARTIAGALTGGNTPPPGTLPAHQDPPAMLDLPDASEHDLSPFLLRRLRLAADLARDLQADAARTRARTVTA
ncbi:FUSC family protein [Ramlibacter sp. G-1-2-2]|uniref:FUSC family protein n=1 Tax=Ramlibacter agri TaxID=2728837 RepID=A0A848HIS9_9BURK|nr:FUSC family protein [Ramlibacter agri]NML47628.1 FUSC family protein [Ramlibacter agri]